MIMMSSFTHHDGDRKATALSVCRQIRRFVCCADLICSFFSSLLPDPATKMLYVCTCTVHTYNTGTCEFDFSSLKLSKSFLVSGF